MIKGVDTISLEKILLVEDNPDDIKLTQRAFGKCAFCRDTCQLVVVKNGAEAIEYLNTSVLPKLILLDLKLPKMSGFEVLDYIRSNERTRLIPVIILTSSREEKDVKKAYCLGANSYIRKPVDFNRFYEVTQEIGTYWLSINELPL
jgi:two-component system response regulator